MPFYLWVKKWQKWHNGKLKDDIMIELCPTCHVLLGNFRQKKSPLLKSEDSFKKVRISFLKF